MEKFDRLCNLISAEIEKEVVKGSLSPDTIRTIGYGIDILKDLKEIEAMEEASHDGYSGHYPERGWNIRPYYSYDEMDMRMAMDGNDRSYAQRRDSMGRYSRGYSRDERIDTLQRMMDDAKSESERESIRKLILQMENA